MTKRKALVKISLPGAAIIIGVILLLTCLAAPLYSDPRVVWVVRLLFGMFGLLCVILGLLGFSQERLRSRVVDDAGE